MLLSEQNAFWPQTKHDPMWPKNQKGHIHKLVFGQGSYDEDLLCLKWNLSMSVPQQDEKQAEFLSKSHCHYAVLWPFLSYLTTQRQAVRPEGKETVWWECVSGTAALNGLWQHMHTKHHGKTEITATDQIIRRSSKWDFLFLGGSFSLSALFAWRQYKVFCGKRLCAL